VGCIAVLYRSIALLSGLLALSLFTSAARAAQPTVGLGTAGDLAVLGGSTVTNTGPSVIDSGLAVSPGSAITGFPPGVVNGTVNAADAVAAHAQADLRAAYDDAAGRAPAAVLPADAGGLFLTPGVYRRPSSLQLTGNVTLDGQGDPGAVFIFQAGTLTTASNSRVVLTGGARACNVFWQIGSSATLGTDTDFSGDILALQSITLNTRATIIGRALARNGATTLDSNTIRPQRCAAATAPGGAPGPGGTTTPGGGGVPAPTPGANGTALVQTQPRAVGETAARFGTRRCVSRRFRATVQGMFIRSVTFLIDGRRIGSRSKAPFAATIDVRRGRHKLRAHVSFTDGTRARDLGFHFKPCAQQARRVRPPRFTG
jgi:ice-binding like protein